MNGTEKNGVGRREGESEAGGSSVAGVFMEDLRMGGRVVCCDPRDCARLVRRPGLITTLSRYMSAALECKCKRSAYPIGR
jgi:hypothetical protein